MQIGDYVVRKYNYKTILRFSGYANQEQGRILEIETNKDTKDTWIKK